MFLRVRSLVSILIVTVLFADNASSFMSSEGREDISSGIPRTVRINRIKGVNSTNTLYVATNSGIYTSHDLGKNWRKETMPGEIVDVRDVAFSGDQAIAATQYGLYEYSDGKWDCKAGKSDLKGVAYWVDRMEQKTYPLIWTSEELYIIRNGTWSLINMEKSEKKIEDVVFNEGIIYVAVAGMIYYSRDGGNIWDKYVLLDTDDNKEEAGLDIEEIEKEEADLPIIRKLEPVEGYGMIAATVKGIYTMRIAESVEVHKIGTTGLGPSSVIFAIGEGKDIYAASRDKVFRCSTGLCSWESIFGTTGQGDLTCLYIMEDREGKKRLLIAAEKGLYAIGIEDLCEKGRLTEGPGLVEVGPTVTEVQGMAIEYAEVSPEKIKKWREGAKWKAVMPKVSVGYAESFDDKVEIYTNATTAYTVTGPRAKGDDWNFDLSWDLADIVWNDAQTSIDVRSKLMVQLRNDILEEVTRIYFERKKLLAELLSEKARKSDIDDVVDRKHREKELRVQELTAYLDAYTGGWFSSVCAKK